LNYSENPNAAPELQPSPVPDVTVPLPSAAAPGEPVWSGWDVLRILLIGVVAIVVTIVMLVAVVHGPTLRDRLNLLNEQPELLILGQMAAYLILLGYMYILVTKERRQPRFWEAMRWNWPSGIWFYLLVGLLMQAIFLVIEAEKLLPFPKDMPIEALLKRPYSLILIAVFSVTLGPLMEELFFRGFLYPVLKRSLGVFVAVLATALPFGLMHAAQYGYSWASVLLISIVGVVLAVVREKQNSLAAAFLVHFAYNGTIIALIFIGTSGFRHLERIGSQ
jgi:membrane protease YdiL (CAAX protease family)